MSPPTPDAPRTELATLVALAVPLAASFAGSTLLGFADTAMVGRLGSEALAAVGIGSGIFFAFTLVGMGLINGLDPLLSQALGAGEPKAARTIFWQGVRLALLASVPLVVGMIAVALALETFGIAPATARSTRLFLLGRALGIVPLLLVAACRSFLQCANFTRAIVVSIAVANVVNAIANALLIFGDEALVWAGLPAVGLPPLGILGSAIASTIASFASLLVVLPAIRALEPSEPDGGRAANRAAFVKIARLGLPIALQLGAEVGIFTTVTLLAGRMGTTKVAGHHVALSLVSFTFTVALGIASATAVLVGKAIGRADTPAARRMGFLGARLASTFMALCAVLFLVAPEACASLLTDDHDVRATAAPLIRIAAVFQLSDGLQVVMAGALRGAGDTRYPQLANLVGHYAVGLPVAVGLGFFTPLGPAGLWWGLVAGLTTVAAALTLRFHRLSSRDVARV